VVATEGVCVVGGELPGPVEEVVDDLELVVAVGRQQLAGAVDEVAEDLLIPGGGGLGGVHDLAAAVTGVGLAADVASPLEAIEDRGDAAGSEAEQAGLAGLFAVTANNNGPVGAAINALVAAEALWIIAAALTLPLRKPRHRPQQYPREEMITAGDDRGARLQPGGLTRGTTTRPGLSLPAPPG
jgi:hypothetical protein